MWVSTDMHLTVSAADGRWRASCSSRVDIALLCRGYGSPAEQLPSQNLMMYPLSLPISTCPLSCTRCTVTPPNPPSPFKCRCRMQYACPSFVAAVAPGMLVSVMYRMCTWVFRTTSPRRYQYTLHSRWTNLVLYCTAQDWRYSTGQYMPSDIEAMSLP